MLRERERERERERGSFLWRSFYEKLLHLVRSVLDLSFHLSMMTSLSFLENKLLILHVVYWNSFIDEGRNPDEYTRNLLNSCVQRNQVSRGKVDAFKVRLIQQSFLVLFSGHWKSLMIYKSAISKRLYLCYTFQFTSRLLYMGPYPC
jgi:hypothetical protein